MTIRVSLMSLRLFAWIDDKEIEHSMMHGSGYQFKRVYIDRTDRTYIYVYAEVLLGHLVRHNFLLWIINNHWSDPQFLENWRKIEHTCFYILASVYLVLLVVFSIIELLIYHDWIVASFIEFGEFVTFGLHVLGRNYTEW